MKKLLYGAICMILFVSLTACGGGTDKDTTKNNDTTNKTEQNDSATNTAADGEKVFQGTCAACHGNDLKSGYAPDLDKIGSKLSKNDIVKIIHNGKGQMPKQNLSDADANAVAAWLAAKK
ncbi:cytochrome c [Neobacillus sp. OS1-32]|jgi:mono/diheme cytochrome c family protein|uniref:cytochrome c551 n=1 Tax=Neobacillus sp. OS1-32 TaxID=3070682 RepID=UPI0027DF9BBC|nr:cytochrome c [Neobacillus sp. OS1-32]WML32030.1 cytochrome c [Neobacillus sp. OS1-32]